MTLILDTVLPRRLGVGFRWLIASSWTSNLGDGVALAAAPLLVASETHSPFLVALAALLIWVPPLVLGLYAGALTDRLDRRRLVMTADLTRVGVLVLLSALVATDHVSIVVVLLSGLVIGTAELFADNASQTLVPMLVARDDLAVANARLQTGFITVNQLIGPPVGAALFTVGRAWPFAVQAALGLAAVSMVARIRLPAHARDPERSARVRDDIVEGFRWVVHHAAVRTLVLTIFTFNITFGAAWSVLVLYATRRLGLGDIGFGLVTTAQATGGVVGVLAYGAITRRVSLGNLMRAGLIIETLTHLGLALTTSPWVALPIFVVFGAHAFVWGTTSISVRQRAVPTELQGRVGAVNLVGVYGGLVLGAGIGGLVAERWGLAAPFWFAFVGSAVFVVLIWGQLTHIAHEESVPLG